MSCLDKLPEWDVNMELFFTPSAVLAPCEHNQSASRSESEHWQCALDHDQVCGQRALNDTRLTMPSQPVPAVRSLLGPCLATRTSLYSAIPRLHTLLELNIWFTSKTSSMSLLPNTHRFTFYGNQQGSIPKQGDILPEFKD